ncbi:Vtype ATPase, G subunit [Acanthamoeba castellanii str. Neff]|uniref:V-type proton ATPase subunit G n=1 Tax=Acanthamoeba castellanii (strain ATCC 30010 / Neff) TaxID=1257118 RepID=L8H9M3_ACACF|nr:Vtype ATPase, G subunit [Acanthamoeba castellanii str. Neff]ELR21890.1 Vtype ATPase, G subunit [Acanthamoeba castellanii str. Neff]
MTTKTTFGINELLSAEREAQVIITQARKEKDAKRKQAEAEAAKEIAAYKAEREAHYRKYEQEHGTSSTDYNKTLDEKTVRDIQQVQRDAKENEDTVVELLLKSVKDVHIA